MYHAVFLQIPPPLVASFGHKQGGYLEMIFNLLFQNLSQIENNRIPCPLWAFTGAPLECRRRAAVDRRTARRHAIKMCSFTWVRATLGGIPSDRYLNIEAQTGVPHRTSLQDRKPNRVIRR